jgi:hypothetical protein
MPKRGSGVCVAVNRAVRQGRRGHAAGLLRRGRRQARGERVGVHAPGPQIVHAVRGGSSQGRGLLHGVRGRAGGRTREGLDRAHGVCHGVHAAVRLVGVLMRLAAGVAQPCEQAARRVGHLHAIAKRACDRGQQAVGVGFHGAGACETCLGSRLAICEARRFPATRRRPSEVVDDQVELGLASPLRSVSQIQRSRDRVVCVVWVNAPATKPKPGSVPCAESLNFSSSGLKGRVADYRRSVELATVDSVRLQVADAVGVRHVAKPTTVRSVMSFERWVEHAFEYSKEAVAVQESRRLFITQFKPIDVTGLNIPNGHCLEPDGDQSFDSNLAFRCLPVKSKVREALWLR